MQIGLKWSLEGEQSTEPAELSLVQTQTLESVSAPGVGSDREILIHLMPLSIQSKGKCVKYIHYKICPQPSLYCREYIKYKCSNIFVSHSCTIQLTTC